MKLTPISRVQAPRLTVEQKKAVEALLSTADADGLRVEFMLQVCSTNFTSRLTSLTLLNLPYRISITLRTSLTSLTLCT